VSEALRVGIGGPVGSGKTRLVERLVPRLSDAGLSVAVITNDLVTDEDAQRVRRSGVIDPGRVLAVETGACPHTAIREDPSANLAAAERLNRRFTDLDVILIESGGDNLAATFTSDLVDYWIFVIDTAAGDDIPRKKGIGLLQADLLVVNKIDLAPMVGADLDRMRRDCAVARPVKPTVFTDLKSGTGLDEVVARLLTGAMLEPART
jgi:urease accessory protein